jgi:hypothetical protein
MSATNDMTAGKCSAERGECPRRLCRLVAGTRLAERTKDTYLERLGDYLSWLAGSADDQHIGPGRSARLRPAGGAL